MSRRSTPERLDEARRAATRNRLMGSGATEETADAWIAAWEAKAAEDGLERGQAYWQAGWDWIATEREHRVKPWGRRHEKKLGEESSDRPWWKAVSDGCSTVALIPMFIIGGILALVAVGAVMLGVNVLAGWMAGLLTKPPLPALIGAGTILFAGWGLFRMATGHAPPGTSRRDKIIAFLVLILFALIGAVFLVAGNAPQARDNPGF